MVFEAKNMALGQDYHRMALSPAQTDLLRRVGVPIDDMLDRFGGTLGFREINELLLAIHSTQTGRVLALTEGLMSARSAMDDGASWPRPPNNHHLSEADIDLLRDVGVPIDAMLLQNGNAWNKAELSTLIDMLLPPQREDSRPPLPITLPARPFV